MTTLTHNPDRNCVNSLGIPVDDLTLEAAVERIVRLARTRDGKPRLVSTLNVDFLVNSLGTGFSRAKHPELLEVLRNSDMVTADGFPILWLSRIVGKPLQQRVCGSDLVPALAQRASEQNLSIFLLGGAEGVARQAADILQAANPGLTIAGTAAPFVQIAGPGLAKCIADEEALVEQINRSGADILLLGLGNPKQELWFNRNRGRLRVPVSIGVGGTFTFITGGIRRAPQWVQRANLEWVYRIAQDPARLWRRYAKGLFKLAALSAPLMVNRAAEMASFAGRQRADDDALNWRHLWSSRDQALAVLRLPRLVRASHLEALISQVEADKLSDGARLIDFSHVRRIEMAGHQALFTLSELQRRNGNIQLLGITPRLERQLAACRVIDILGRSQGNTLSNLHAGIGAGAGQLSCRSYVSDDSALIFLGGTVDDDALRSIAFGECLGQTARDRTCIIDLRNVSLLESSAIATLEPFINDSGDGQVLFSGASDNVRQMFRVAELGAPAHFIDDKELITRISEGAATS
jgi:N-acetylglucosaminyldiphosphoundecaprenol N-acetyl-beta-D-mannosaminyltransferase